MGKREKRKSSKRSSGGAGGMERLRAWGMYLVLDGAISFLFYDSLVAFLCLLPGGIWFGRHVRAGQELERERIVRSQFLTGMQLFQTALQAGYAAENALGEAYRELRRVFPPDSFIVTEFGRMLTGISLNQNVETLLRELGERSRSQDIMDFAEVFVCAKRSGGDLIRIVRNTVSGIEQNQETQREIDTLLAGRQMEQRMMSIVPLLILLYIRLTSPDFLRGLYHTLPGQGIMTGCLLVYLLAYLWGKRIMRIRV